MPERVSGAGEPASSDAPTARSGWRRLRHWARPYLSRPLVWLALRTLPRLFVLYMRLVWATSRIEPNDILRLRELGREHDGFIALVWHEEVLLTAYGYPKLGFELHTLASVGDAGEIIARALELCGFEVFRGGTASRSSRRRLGVLRSMIDHMRERDDVQYGITVDGSKGPAYQVKDGAISIGRATGRPIVLARIWSSRCVPLRTWDRTAIPLPFGRIALHGRGPYFAPAASEGEVAAERFRLEMEAGLIELAGHSHDALGEARPPELLAAARRNAAERAAAEGDQAAGPTTAEGDQAAGPTTAEGDQAAGPTTAERMKAQ